MQRKEISKLKSRKKLWKIFNWTFPGSGLGFFRKNHSLNETHFNRSKHWENKTDRQKNKQNLKKLDIYET